MTNKHVIIIGAGPAGLYAAYSLLEKNFRVTVIDRNSGAGRKFLIAGHSGLNVTHSEVLKDFLTRFHPHPSIVTAAIENFPPKQIQKFYENTLATKLFCGSTGHVFPVDMKGGKVLINWLKILNDNPNYKFIKRSVLTEIKSDNVISISTEGSTEHLQADYFIYALGGASWSKTGSKGDWGNIFSKHDIQITRFMAKNCGHEVSWSDHFKSNILGSPLKNITISLKDQIYRGEILLTPYGVEGQLIYKLTHLISEFYNNDLEPKLFIDLVPDHSTEKIIEKLDLLDQKLSLSTKLKKALKLTKSEILLLNEFRDSFELNETKTLSKLLKSIPIKLNAPRPIDEAISTSGGIALTSVSDHFELTKLKNHFCIGEMLDWSAPTGGYLLSACLATAHTAAQEIIKRN